MVQYDTVDTGWNWPDYRTVFIIGGLDYPIIGPFARHP